MVPKGLPSDHIARLARARVALEGLSVGDAFGGRFFNAPTGDRLIPPPPWQYSDDTEMAVAIVEPGRVGTAHRSTFMDDKQFPS